jgi:hypothetical protein
MHLFNVTNKFGEYAEIGGITADRVDQMTAKYFYQHMLRYRAQEHWQIVSAEQDNMAGAKKNDDRKSGTLRNIRSV